MRAAGLALAVVLAAIPAAASPPPEDLPDLVAVDMTYTPADAAPGDHVVFRATVTNVGPGDAGPSVVQFCIAAMGWIVFTDMPALGAGATIVVESEPWPATGTSHQAQAFLDIDDALAEVSETNNEFELPFTLQSGPDLVVAAVATDPSSPVQGDAVTVRAEVRNAGARRAGSFAVAFFVDGDYLGSATVDGLDPAESRVVEGPLWAATTGPHEALADADADQEVAENDENNNAASLAFEVAATSHLALAPTGDAAGGVAVALEGDATGILAISVLGDSEANRLAASAMGDATAPGAAAASVAGDSRGAVAVSVLGRAEGSTLGVSACGLAGACPG